MLNKPETRIIPEEIPRSFYLQHLKTYSFVKDNVDNKIVLDVGCGDGYGAAFLAERAKFVQAVDYDSEVVLSAQKKYKKNNLSYSTMDALKLEFQDRKFDIVCSFQVIEHIPEKMIATYLNELKRVLSNKGILYLSTLNLSKVMKSSKTYEKNLAHYKEFRLEELRETISGVFQDNIIYGLHLSPKHYFFSRLKKSGIFKFFPSNFNPVSKFFTKDIGLDDYRLSTFKLKTASDFVCRCVKHA
ncbi:MAG TPA: class I SAM-dependent methyltransferase [Candidatus Omnitrophota bacterium]|nr:class I SAM-dependent methyltransferase [Candidatus Omnitrophota bacterium]